ncbi:MAG: hypothetical protein CM15mP103_00710 [Gammaproteobacteria bacterium]|nr:MAG: hypothetical protein CM15mP103_00710 [Gammaproteobacteria bacterium]
MGQRLASNISEAVAQLDAITEEGSTYVNEVHKLGIASTRCRWTC